MDEDMRNGTCPAPGAYVHGPAGYNRNGQAGDPDMNEWIDFNHINQNQSRSRGRAQHHQQNQRGRGRGRARGRGRGGRGRGDGAGRRGNQRPSSPPF